MPINILFDNLIWKDLFFEIMKLQLDLLSWSHGYVSIFSHVLSKILDDLQHHQMMAYCLGGQVAYYITAVDSSIQSWELLDTKLRSVYM